MYFMSSLFFIHCLRCWNNCHNKQCLQSIRLTRVNVESQLIFNYFFLTPAFLIYMFYEGIYSSM